MNPNNEPGFRVVSTEIETKQGKNGDYYTQAVMFERGDGASYPVDVFVDKGKPHAPGQYAISKKSYTPSKYGIDFKPTLGALIPAAK